uniref:Uncharacterized protein n=1 Tax=Candidatus Kentrum sp. LFY TaxID=2126342 RepID=A0A450UVK4_9GAMM|nr:MAG: hypothetical protein BECKLFY1418B_GA0070995_108611 [Candidatus Kentron sp. LFY]
MLQQYPRSCKESIFPYPRIHGHRNKTGLQYGISDNILMLHDITIKNGYYSTGTLTIRNNQLALWELLRVQCH